MHFESADFQQKITGSTDHFVAITCRQNIIKCSLFCQSVEKIVIFFNLMAPKSIFRKIIRLIIFCEETI